ncbi:hypothetical protein J2S21_003460 [Peribacillus cavernae]|nr:hypothetical protein [Peribacillus cavernae]
MTSGHLVGSRKLVYGPRTATFVNNVTKGAITGIATAVGYTYGRAGGATIAGLATSVGEYVNTKPTYLKIRTWESYSSYYKRYLVDHYATYYTSSSFTTVKKTFTRYDVHRVGATIGQ